MICDCFSIVIYTDWTCALSSPRLDKFAHYKSPLLLLSLPLPVGQLFCPVLAYSLHKAPMPIIQDVLRTTKISIKASPADGHCLFYHPRLTTQQVKDLLCNDLHPNFDIYAPSVNMDKASINQQLKLYIMYKRYKKQFVVSFLLSQQMPWKLNPPKVLLLCCSWGACVPRRSQRLCQRPGLEARLNATLLILATSVFGRILLTTLLCDVLVKEQAGHLMAQWCGMHGSCLVPFVMLTPTIL